jgi:glyoxylase-like metal-dependent hydrolase (beta-lactamase superfamily II)
LVMRRFAIVGALALWSASAGSQDASAVLGDVARVLGAADLKTVQYSGSGFAYAFAQNYRPDVPYPKFHATYSRAIDYDRSLSREETTRTQFENPPRGGGGQPLYREARAAAVSGESSGWGAGAVALTPHGFIKAAMRANPTVSSRQVAGRAMTVIAFAARNRFRVEGYINAQHLIERIDTWTANPILGDMPIETTFSEYREFALRQAQGGPSDESKAGGVRFPTRIVQRQGGFPTLEITVTEVRPNAAVDLQPPSGGGQPARAEGHRIGDGVWYLAGTPEPNSQLVEFRDYTVLIESSVTEARALANLAEARRLVPNKPVRYHVNSHHHGDHAAGLRAFVAEGVTIVTHEMNRAFYEQTVLKNPHTLAPDVLAQKPRPARWVWVKDRHGMSDGTRMLEIYHVPNGHTVNLLMGYIRQEKLLIITDIFNDFGESRPNDPPPGLVSPYYAALGDRVRQLKLDVARIAPSHGKGTVAAEVLWKALEGKVQAPQLVGSRQ